MSKIKEILENYKADKISLQLAEKEMLNEAFTALESKDDKEFFNTISILIGVPKDVVLEEIQKFESKSLELSKMKTLEQRFKEALESENYELCATIKAEIDARKG